MIWERGNFQRAESARGGHKMLISSVFLGAAAVFTVLVPDVGGLRCYDCIGGKRGTDDLGCLTSEPNPSTLKEFKGNSVMCLTVFVTTEIAGANDTLTIRTSRNESGRYRDGECTDNFPEFQAIFMPSHVYGCFCNTDECNHSNVQKGPSLMVLLATLSSIIMGVSYSWLFSGQISMAAGGIRHRVTSVRV